MGSDLFGSLAEATCAALVVAAQTHDIRTTGWSALCFPLTITSIGLLVGIVISLLATTIFPVYTEGRIELTLRVQMIVATALMIPAIFVMAIVFLPERFEIDGVSKRLTTTRLLVATCAVVGELGGLCIGLTAEYYTSKTHPPVRRLVNACRAGAGTNIIAGLALGYRSTVAPVFILAVVVYTAFELCDLYGVALAAVGMLGTLAVALTIDAYGPVCDNAGRYS